MIPFFDEQGSTLYHGKAEAVLPALPENFVDTVITDPPYGLSFMGKHWDHGVPAAEVWSAVARVCKPGAMLLAFGGDRTHHHLMRAIEDGGWELRTTMAWIFGSGFPKSLDISKAIDKAAGADRADLGPNPNRVGRHQDIRSGSLHAVNDKRVSVEHIDRITRPATDSAKLWSGWGTALKPAFEIIIVAMKPLDGTFAENAQKWGTAGLNIDGGRIHADDAQGGAYTVKRLKPGATLEATGGNWRPDDGPLYHGEMKPGRWPANVLLDAEAAAQLDEMSGQLSSGVIDFAKHQDRSNRDVYGGFPNGDARQGRFGGDSGGASRFFYTSKASRSDRGHGNNHPTVKPTDLLKYLCKLTATPTGGAILDPFVGSGTTMVAAREYGRPCIGIEMEEEHCRIVIERLRQGVLFGATV